LLTDKFRLSDIAVKIANYRATAEKIAEAREWAARAGGLLPDQSWKQKQVGDFFLNLGDTHTAILYYDRAIAVADNAETRAAALIALAEAYRKLGDSETFINYAEQYIAIVTTRDVETPQESGLAWYYQGEIFTIRQKPDEAYRAYETASTLLTDKFRLSETFLKMAQYNAENSRNEGLAVEQALMSANLLPDQAWRVRDAAQILIHIGCVDDAARIMEEAIALNPVENGELFQDIANAYNQALRRNSALANNSRYIDFLYQKMDRLGAAVTEQQWVQLWNARQQQSNMSRTWGLDSYLFSNKQQGGDYYVGMLHELFYNYRIKNGMFGKIYGKYGGTLAARYSGTYYSPFFDEMQQWQSRQHLNESQYAILGIRINPINIAPALSFSLEGHIGIGDDTENDVVGRIIYDASAGLDLKPSGNHWAYWKIYSDTAYSTRNEDITSSGYLRGGVTVRGNFDRTLLFAPYGTMLYSYGGKDVSKGTRWGADAGMGLMIRKWFRQDRYHTPRSYVEANIFVIWGLSKDRNRAFGIDLSTSF
ncbi:MAG: hypothetical protein LIP23_05855, partial [Planctomycetes bacterium]|nr:hypothetical protein [Planctomycetota bacterium]